MLAILLRAYARCYHAADYSLPDAGCRHVTVFRQLDVIDAEIFTLLHNMFSMV